MDVNYGDFRQTKTLEALFCEHCNIQNINAIGDDNIMGFTHFIGENDVGPNFMQIGDTVIKNTGSAPELDIATLAPPSSILASNNTWTGTNTFNNTVTVSGLTANQAVVTNGSSQLTSKQYSTIATGSTLVERTSNGDIEGRFIRAGSAAGGGLSIRSTAGQAATMSYTGASSFNVSVPDAGSATTLPFTTTQNLWTNNNVITSTGNIILQNGGFVNGDVVQLGASSQMTPIKKSQNGSIASSLCQYNSSGNLSAQNTLTGVSGLTLTSTSGNMNITPGSGFLNVNAASTTHTGSIIIQQNDAQITLGNSGPVTIDSTTNDVTTVINIPRIAGLTIDDFVTDQSEFQNNWILKYQQNNGNNSDIGQTDMSSGPGNWVDLTVDPSIEQKSNDNNSGNNWGYDTNESRIRYNGWPSGATRTFKVVCRVSIGNKNGGNPTSQMGLRLWHRSFGELLETQTEATFTEDRFMMLTTETTTTLAPGEYILAQVINWSNSDNIMLRSYQLSATVIS